jgi:hypothetical protein
VDEGGNILGFSVMKVSALKKTESAVGAHLANAAAAGVCEASSWHDGIC